jgi:hypothetical protein
MAVQTFDIRHFMPRAAPDGPLGSAGRVCERASTHKKTSLPAVCYCAASFRYTRFVRLEAHVRSGILSLSDGMALPRSPQPPTAEGLRPCDPARREQARRRLPRAAECDEKVLRGTFDPVADYR